MVKIHENQRTQKFLMCAVCAWSFRAFVKKSLIVLSVFVSMLSYSAAADTPIGYTEYTTFPTMSGGDFMKEKSIYKNAAVAANMLGITSGTIVAEPVYVTVSCSENQYLTDNNTCEACPTTHPKSTGAAGGISQCYKTVTRGCTQNACVCPDNSTCTCGACSCGGGTYIEYQDGKTSGTTDNETCNKTVATTTCVAGYYMNNGTCTACAKGTYKAEAGNATSCTTASDGYYVPATAATAQTQCPVGYRDGSNGDRDEITDCYKTVTRGCTQNACACAGNSTCTCSDCACTGETYTQYVAADGTSNGTTSGTTTNETCNQTVASTTCTAGYYMNNGTCTACAKGTYKAEAGNATSCTVASDGYYVPATAATAQTQCPVGYRDGSNGGRDEITDCYKTVTRGCTQNACACAGNSTCTCSDCACTGETYKRHVASNGTSDGTAEGTTDNETCNKTVATTTCVAGYYMNNGTCTACAKGTYKAEAGNATSCTVADDKYYVDTTAATAQTQCPVGYRDGSNGGRDEITDCYKTVTRGCTQNNGSTPSNCASVTSWNACTCTGGTYKRHVASNGTSEGEAEGTSTNETCTKTPATVTANAGSYVDGATCKTCPADWSSSVAGNTGGVTACYKTVTRGCTQTPCTCPGESTCTCASCQCTGGTYTQYVAADGTSNGTTSGTTTNETCNQTVASITCAAGYYMNNGTCTACAKGTYKAEAGNATSCTTASEGSYVDTTAATAQTQCPAGLVSPQGTTSESGCGKTMYVDNTKLYLTSAKQTSPALAVRIDGKVYYANMTALSNGAKTMNSTTTKSLRTKIDGIEYSIHDNTVQEE